MYLAAFLRYLQLVSMPTHQSVPLPCESLYILSISPVSKELPGDCDISKNRTGVFGERNSGL